MSVGGLLAYFNFEVINPYLSNMYSSVAVLVISLSSWFFISERSLFPGWWALLPTLSAVLIILGRHSHINRFVLANKVSVFIGKISYPLYLWHWPFLVFSRLLYPSGSTSIFADTSVVVLLSVVFSVITYLLV
jgi:peptidoglycan/LPS O-acetylase OafA/YrhL